jgi:hypothetical protein
MTLFQFAKRLCRYLKVKDPAGAQIDTATEILDAINNAVTEYFMAGPAQLRRRPWGFTLSGAESRTIGVTNGSATITGDAASDLYKRFSIPGDITDGNRLVASHTLKFPFTGPTGSTVATVHGDAVPLPEDFCRGTADPFFLPGQGYTLNVKNLVRRNCVSALASIGRPVFYWIESLGVAGGYATGLTSHPAGFLRVWPTPETAYRLEMEIEIKPVQFSLEHLTAGADDITGLSAEIPVGSEHLTTVLEPLALQHLAGGGLWETPETIQLVTAKLKSAYDIMGTATKDLTAPRRSFLPMK